MKLQVAMDVITLDAALTLAAQVAPHVDIIELGTPLIKSEGLRAVTAIKKAHPDKLVFADLKTMDAGELEADIAFTAGADFVTVLGTAGDSTIIGAVKAATAHGKGIVVDLIGVADKVTRAREVTAMGAVFVEMHAGLDEQAEPGFTFQTLLDDGEASKVPFSVAGGVNLTSIKGVQRAGATVAVAGGAIYGAADPAAAAAELRAAII
ncbi:orotidine 5'-phosphate decarboxylase [Cryobacterium breve]|jgi:3-hexulose-6-phosphate synthase|uniref:3-hexulose-6-phosphate synthase n=1 Tax=Cryobacterium breve TaxID=1259258 RepID=A0ABY7NAQ9_9MICO|nr:MULTISPECIES: 3-hexulose-6-phosphate synthase [Cryobacterium]MDY7542919.1 3-hexulose-6-phosphate synthase [Cryobacterium sp. 5B3]MEA9999237.1 orotidine 5'-phosphate decarboxylase [Cryobacterium sp. RTS3]MEB0265378.1 orotidine 5'-phosphate decarboxylase [Cryobacterium sp. 10I5]MEB0274898.1 orotidine 5'-phosphate decarboxylase [Cryobacterium sp. 5B3]WBM79591.1 orotidine 5'-phosphate decarboxylase [Cryobacterium breve]